MLLGEKSRRRSQRMRYFWHPNEAAVDLDTRRADSLVLEFGCGEWPRVY
jgi:hypothetical protein